MTQEHSISAAEYLASCRRRFGSANPQRMRVPVWEWMVRTGQDPYFARESLKLESNYGRHVDPDWCFDRMGAAQVEMADGRIITIAGEHEDSYDRDFCIYNDVVVQQGDDVEIYGYPRSIFPPTDFHTATLVGANIVIIGSLGYPEDRSPSLTSVFRLDTADYRIEGVETKGESPGWIHKHQSEYLKEEGVIELTGGELLFRRGEAERFRDNFDTYHLQVAEGFWHRITDNSEWRQFSLEYADNERTLGDLGWYTGEVLRQLGYPCELYNDVDDDECTDRPHVLLVNGVPVQCMDRDQEIRVTIQGTLAQSEIDRLLAKLKDAARKTYRSVTAIEEL